ncbi:hypothetical protein AV530_003610 [Patagioenas fasciata monilis]|uniref:Uncharacterized protein n=1 Tax=Patagioenas fasciata monilis TaxID=372326 RepID=A0A1V4KY89_PATFA|nr:hypothetical protein AV530_003610 [Patagioenas fasciata monilis]
MIHWGFWLCRRIRSPTGLLQPHAGLCGSVTNGEWKQLNCFPKPPHPPSSKSCWTASRFLVTPFLNTAFWYTLPLTARHVLLRFTLESATRCSTSLEKDDFTSLAGVPCSRIGGTSVCNLNRFILIQNQQSSFQSLKTIEYSTRYPFVTNARHMSVINPTPCACSVLFAQSPTCALSSKYEGDVFGVAAAAGAPSSSPGRHPGLAVGGYHLFYSAARAGLVLCTLF